MSEKSPAQSIGATGIDPERREGLKMTEKPPTQSIGVSSIEAGKMGEIGGASFVHNWRRLSEAPKFQTYAYEQCKQPYDQVEQWIEPFIINAIQAGSEQALFDSYVQWHDKQGYWKNEDPYGNIIDSKPPIEVEHV
ncbi:hypothetical protein [Acinetobacter tianfuensis]|uniref:Uncharacterized protein n=1 Tax=Acinetobacter tianfuensis TaxID=2419603 RepID=A0A3A8EZ61_9GAMM|nr:hypothetical protein [Acinetobacter tianfuensis]RKG33733.1 hypothetical protein D7V32_02730 [Acinetobacter tianfuensis]